MEIDRKNIARIVGDMLDNPDATGIYPTSHAYDALERYVEKVRFRAVGWAHADACTMLDKGDDPRTADIADLFVRVQHDLGEE